MKDDQGSTTLVGAFVIAALMVLAVLLSWVCAAASARHRAQSEADLAALAGAYRAVDGQEAACAAARALVARSSGLLASCRVEDLDVLVVVEVDIAGAGFSFGPARAAARAGPAPG
jgi:secretion/DNA translocation related TadE-like protein